MSAAPVARSPTRRLAAVLMLAGACGTSFAQASRHDPFEPWNRSVFAFNEAVDRALLRPLATAYKTVLPDLVRTGVDNVFGNVADAWSAVNLLLQGKIEGSASMTLRVATNTVFGVGGLFDLASEAGLERQPEDLGQTLGRWGFGPGPYLVLPLYGPSTLRDALALPVDRQASLGQVVDHGRYRTALTSLELVKARADLLAATRLLEQVALDRYVFVRDSHLARRRHQVFDGNPPEETEDEDAAAPQSRAVNPNDVSSVHSQTQP